MTKHGSSLNIIIFFSLISLYVSMGLSLASIQKSCNACILSIFPKNANMSTWQVDMFFGQDYNYPMIGDIAHICNRGVRKEKIFHEDRDYLRFVLSLYRLNNKEGSLRIMHKKNPFDDLPEQNKLVEILKCSLMPNHYHLLLYEKVEGGIVEFMKRLGNAYTKYFNKKNSGSGYLFQNSAKIIKIENDGHFLYIPFYIDLNPIDLIESDWKEFGIKDPAKAMGFLSNYSWRSFRDYSNPSPFTCIINQDLFYELFDQ